MNRRTRLTIAGAFFIIALIHSTLWSIVTPLWQIPDEPAHYEYVRLLVKLGRLPHKGDEDPAIQADLLRSMWQNHYWEYLGFRRPDQPPTRILAGGWTSGGDIPDTAVIGDAYIYAFSGLGNSQPFYYLMLAPVQVAVANLPIDDQLRALRGASHVLFALAVMFITLAATEIFGNMPALVIETGLIAALQPMFAYIGSGVNNDVGVTLMMALLVWQVTLAWKNGFSWQRILLIIATAVIAVYTKRTAIFSLAWIPLVLVARWVSGFDRKKLMRVAVAAICLTGGTILLACLLYLTPGKTPADWLNSEPACQAWSSLESYAGSRAFMLNGGCSVNHTLLTSVQLPIGKADGSPVVFSALVKASEPGVGIIQVKDDSGHLSETQFAVSTDWQRVSAIMTTTISANRLTFGVTDLSPTVMYIDDMSAVLRTTQTITLSVPNPSAENVTPVLGEGLLSMGRILGVYGTVVNVIRNYRANLAVLPDRLKTALAFASTSYWGMYGIFARAHNPSVSDNLSGVLAVLTCMALTSTLLQIFVKKHTASDRLLVGLFACGILIMIVQTFAPLLSFAAAGLWLPQGRYLFGGMALIACILGYGWLNWLPVKWQWVGVIGTGMVMGTISCLAFLSVSSFFSIR